MEILITQYMLILRIEKKLNLYRTRGHCPFRDLLGGNCFPVFDAKGSRDNSTLTFFEGLLTRGPSGNSCRPKRELDVLNLLPLQK